MKTAYIDLIRFALANGCTVSVWDGEEWQVKRSTKQGEVVDAVKSVEEARLRIRKGDEIVGSALVSAFGLEPDETVIDWSETQFMAEWEAQCY